MTRPLEIRVDPGREASPAPVAARPGGHPGGLLAAEAEYLVHWGSPQIMTALVAAGQAVIGVAVLSVMHSALWLLVLPPVLAAGGLAVLFFRNPRRSIPLDREVFLAPADGRVVEVGPAEESEYIQGGALKIGIFLSIFDVHLNRAPCSGRVEYLKHRPGRHRDARDPRSSAENESQAIGIAREDGGGPPGARVLVRQISGAIARRIICPLSVGDPVERGRLVGMIKYGSRTELLVSAGSGSGSPEALVKVGDRVRAGETVLCRYRT